MRETSFIAKLDEFKSKLTKEGKEGKIALKEARLHDDTIVELNHLQTDEFLRITVQTIEAPSDRPTKFYVSTSWTNADAARELAMKLRNEHFDVDCFAERNAQYGNIADNLGPGETVWDAANAHTIEHCKTSDLDAIIWADAIIMIATEEKFPGNDSHFEFGYGLGKGKKLFIVGPVPQEYQGIFHQAARHFETFTGLIEFLSGRDKDGPHQVTLDEAMEQTTARQNESQDNVRQVPWACCKCQKGISEEDACFIADPNNEDVEKAYCPECADLVSDSKPNQGF